MHSLFSAGKRAYCETNSYLGNNYTNTSLADACFFPTTWDAAQVDPSAMAPFPNCSYDNANPNGRAWYGNNFTRVLDGGDLAVRFRVVWLIICTSTHAYAACPAVVYACTCCGRPQKSILYCYYILYC